MGSTDSTHEISFRSSSEEPCSMVNTSSLSPWGVAFTKISPKRPAPTIGHVRAENNCSGRWLFAEAFVSS